MAEDREALYAALNEAMDTRARADERFKSLSRGEVEAAEDPIALQDMERDLEVIRHEIATLDVQIADLESKIIAAGGSLG